MTRAEEPAHGKLMIAVGGFSGSGKTSLARALQKEIANAVHIDADATRREILGIAETGPFPEGSFTAEVTQRMIADMHRRVREALTAGKSVIVSSIFNTLPSRAEQERLAADGGALFSGLWLQADKSVLLDRVTRRVNDVSEAGAEVVHGQMSMDAGAITWRIIDAALPREDVLKMALEAL
jgi:predicted kinase